MRIIHEYKTINVPYSSANEKTFVSFKKIIRLFVLVVVLKVDVPHALKYEK